MSQVAFLFSWDTLSYFFLSSPRVCWCQLPRWLNICRFPFLRAFIIIIIIYFFVSWWFLSGVWETASLLNFPEPFSSILSDLNALVWLVSSLPLISKFLSLFTNPFQIDSSVPTTWYNRHLHLPKFFVLCEGLGTYLSFCLTSVIPYDLPGRQCPLFGRFSFFLSFTITRSGRLIEIRWSVLYQNPRKSLSLLLVLLKII